MNKIISVVISITCLAFIFTSCTDSLSTSDSAVTSDIAEENAGTDITLENTTASINGNGAEFSENTLKITSAGTYSIKGNMTDGQVIVDTDKDSEVVLILDGTEVACSTNSPLYIRKAKKVTVQLAEETSNTLTDGSEYIFEDDEDEPDAALFSKSDLEITGSGSLNVNGNYKNGIASKDTLIVSGGSITVTAMNACLKGKDSVLVSDGNVKATATGDTIHSKGDVTISGGTLNLSSGDDGIHADNILQIDGGKINIEKSYEGLEGLKIYMNGGEVSVYSSDDGINASDGSGSSEQPDRIPAGDAADRKDFEKMTPPTNTDIGNPPADMGTPPEMPDNSDMQQFYDKNFGRDGGIKGGMGIDEANPDCIIELNGGTLYVNANGDGIDSNGSVYFNGCNVTVDGPVSNGDSPLDYAGECTVSSGNIICAGSSGMAQTTGSSSDQNSIMFYFDNTVSAGTNVTLYNSDNKVIMTHTPSKDIECVLLSSPEIKIDSSYYVKYGDSETEAVTVASAVTTSGTPAERQFGGMQGGGKFPVNPGSITTN